MAQSSQGLKLPQNDPRVQYRPAPLASPPPDNIGGLTGPQVTPVQPNRCGTCRFFTDGDSCSLVAGDIDPAWVCDLYLSPSGKEEMAGYRLFVDAMQAFADPAKPPEWIPFIPKPGVYKHPMYGEVAITPERVAGFVSSVQNHVYQEHIPLDLEHQTKLSGAAAWIRGMRVNADGGADAQVEWTPRGQKALQDGGFRYTSPEWWPTWTDPTTGTIHKDIIIGGALTTRPFFKDKAMRALVASETGYRIVAEDEPYWFRDFSQSEREELAQKGEALPDGSFPIPDVASLKDAINTAGLGKSPGKARAFIKRRATALGATNLIPEGWNEGGNMAGGNGGTQGKGSAASDDDADDDEDGSGAASGGNSGQASKPASKSGGKQYTEPVTQPLTMAEVDARIAAAVTAAQTAAEQSFTEKLEAEKTARQHAETALATLTEERRTQRFTDIVMGRGAADGSPRWFGEAEANVILLKQIAEKFGEDSDLFRSYVAQQQAQAKAFRESATFKEFGTSASGATAGSPEARLESLARQKMAADTSGKLSYAQAYNQVLETSEGAQIYSEIPVKS